MTEQTKARILELIAAYEAAHAQAVAAANANAGAAEALRQLLALCDPPAADPAPSEGP